MDILVAFTLLMICQFEHILHVVYMFSCFYLFSTFFLNKKMKQNILEK